MVTGVDIMYNFKKQIADIGKKLADKGLSPGFSGNISVRFEDKILVTPSGYSLGELEADDIVVFQVKGGQSIKRGEREDVAYHVVLSYQRDKGGEG